MSHKVQHKHKHKATVVVIISHDVDVCPVGLCPPPDHVEEVGGEPGRGALHQDVIAQHHELVGNPRLVLLRNGYREIRIGKSDAEKTKQKAMIQN